MTLPAAPPPGVVPAAAVDSRLRTVSLPAPSTVEEVVERLTQIVSDYLLTTSPDDQFKNGGRDVLFLQIDWHVKQNVPIELYVRSLFNAQQLD